MSPDQSPLRTAVTQTVALTVVAFGRLVGAVGTTARMAWRLLRRLAHDLWSLCATGYNRTEAVLSGPITQFVVGPLQTALVGQRRDVSLFITLLSPVLALGTAWWVGSTVGYNTLTTWVRGTWFGTDPSLAIFLALGGLLALGAISAGVNSGLLPTGLLVSAPVFGVAVTRYGTTVTSSWGSQVVSLPDAVGMASLIAVGFGLPIAIAGFVIGRALRHVVRVYGGRAGPPSTVENA